MASAKAPHTLIPVFLTAELDHEVLSSFLEEAWVGVKDGHQRLSIVTTKDADSNFEPSRPPMKVFDSPFLGFVEHQLRDAIASHKKLTDEVFVMLDEQTRKDGSSCCLVSRKQAHYFAVRSDFRGAQRRLDAILNEASNIQRLRNEAAMAGGILRDSDSAQQIKHMGDDRAIPHFLNKPATDKTWETCCKPVCGIQRDPIIPVFCTAELPLEVLNEFIKAANDAPGWPPEAKGQSLIRIMDSLDLSFLQSSRTKTPYKELPATPFLHYTPQTINRMVQSEFPGTALNCVLFVVLDSFSARDRTCIIAENLIRDDPFLMLVRVVFHDAMSVPVSTTLTGLSYEGLTTRAMQGDGVARL